MKILLIADPASIWTARYVERVLAPRGVKVVLTYKHLSERASASPFMGLYAKHSVYLVNDDAIALTARIPKLRVIVDMLALLARLAGKGPFDAVHVHYVTPWSARLGNLVRPLSKRLVMSFWGSDLLRQSDDPLQSLGALVRNADVLTYGNRSMEARLRRLVGPDGPNLRLIYFGVTGLDEIDRLSEEGNRALSKLRFQLLKDRPVVVVGIMPGLPSSI